MPTALIRSTARRSPAIDKPAATLPAPEQREQRHRYEQHHCEANHDGAHFRRRGSHRNRVGVVRSDGFHGLPPTIAAALRLATWSRAGRIKFNGGSGNDQCRGRSRADQGDRSGSRAGKRKRRAPDLEGGGSTRRPRTVSAVAQTIGRAFPQRDIVCDHAGRLHRRLAELGITRNLALHTLPFGVEQLAEALQFGNQVLDFR
jgi:hypothetical protein